jgi:hypothetical protein
MMDWARSRGDGLLIVLLATIACGDSGSSDADDGTGTGDGTGNGNGTGGDGTGDGGTGDDGGTDDGGTDDGGTDDGGTPEPTCEGEGGVDPVAEPMFVMNLPGNTAWYSSPAIADLDGDGDMEIVAPFYDIFVYDHEGSVLDQEETDNHHYGRVYAPGVVADLDQDQVVEVVVGGSDGWVAAYEFVDGGLEIKSGWPALACNDGTCDNVEVRGTAADDLDDDGTLEVIATTTEGNDGGAQVFVFTAAGEILDPPDTAWPDWPRYNTLTGEGNDADANGQGHHGYGCYGLNVGTGNIDDDPLPEILVTYDNHHINAFEPDGRSITASSYFTNRHSDYAGMPLDWGQFIRYLDPAVEEAHYNQHEGDWPGPTTHPWLQWTASPPVAADLDGDGDNEVIGVPNVEENEPYETIFHAVMVLEGSHGDGSRSAMRLPGWEQLPTSGAPWPREPGDWYPPSGVPSPTVANLVGDDLPEIVVPMNDGSIYAFGPDAAPVWSHDYAGGVAKTYASEATVADLNRDGIPEVVFSTYSLEPDAGRLVILSADGTLLHDVVLPDQGTNGNGIGSPAAPTLGDIDGDDTLEVLVMTFDHGLDVFNVPGSGTACMLWPTGRGNLLRNGQGPAYRP